MKIYQVLVTLSYGDGVGNDTLAIDRILKEEGYDTQIFAENIDERISREFVKHISDIPALSREDIVIYHLSTGCDLNEKIKQWDCKIIFRYHNVTPPHFFEEYDQTAFSLCSTGIQQVKSLKDTPYRCLVDSEFNKQDLTEYGYSCEIDVLPIIIPFEDYETKPSDDIIKKYKDNWTNIIFVGRVAPNKKQEDIIKAFSYYKKNINTFSRLIIVGSYNKNDKYYKKLSAYVKMLNIDDVIFTGHTKFNEILGYYKIADLFLCMSEHEGFCIPLVEAMYFNVPIIAYDSAAVPNTMGGKGAIVDTKNSIFISLLIDKIIRDDSIKRHLIDEQSEVLKRYSYQVTKDKFIKFLNKCIK